MSATVGDIERAIFERFPAQWAESWDRVGLVVGDREREATAALVTLDPTRSAIERARALGANVLVTHHPPTLAAHDRMTAESPAGVLFYAADAGVALIAAHTNLDRAREGRETLPNLLGLAPRATIERATQPMARVTVYAPQETSDAMVDAMARAGAGRIGAYERCAFSGEGTGEFTPREGSTPSVGTPGASSRVDERRIEMVCPSRDASRVVAAALAAHPYEEPLVIVEEVEIARSAAALGVLCELPVPATLSEVAALAAKRLRCTPRVWGDAERAVRLVATATGSASSLLGDVGASGADALVCGEVRYHDALNASAAGLCIVECGHDVTEWPLTGPLADAVRATPGLAAGSVIVDEVSTHWWTP